MKKKSNKIVLNMAATLFLVVALIASSVVVYAEEYVTTELELTWNVNVGLDKQDGGKYSDGYYSSTDFITLITDAIYTISITDVGNYTTCTAYWYDADKNFIEYDAIWTNESGQMAIMLTVPYTASYLRLESYSHSSQTDSTQNRICLAMTLSETVIGSSGKTLEELVEISLNGYEGTAVDDATNIFSSEANELTLVEDDLMNQSNLYVEDYTTEAFNTSVLDTLGDALFFVVTWFTNFWNMGGAFTDCLNFLFALSIVFHVIKVR